MALFGRVEEGRSQLVSHILAEPFQPFGEPFHHIFVVAESKSP